MRLGLLNCFSIWFYLADIFINMMFLKVFMKNIPVTSLIILLFLKRRHPEILSVEL